MLLNEGLTELAEQFAALITKGQWGTGTTLPIATDTGLETAVAATLLAVTSATSSGASAQITHDVSSTLGNGSDLTEFELQFASGDSLNRSVGGAISKSATIELTTISTINFIATP